MTAVTYARFSSDKQNESSIDDQVRNCRQWADRHNLNVARHYADRAISGSRSDRPDYLRMLADADDGLFDLLIVDDLSRLSRDDIEMKRALRRLAFIGVRVVSVSDGYDSNQEGSKLNAGMRGVINELYLDDLAKKTHRGLNGLALKGKSAGGKTFGYASRQVDNGWEKIIDKDQAKIVVQIYEWFAAGQTSLEIAGRLNRQGIPSPRGGQWARSAIYGDKRTGVGLLNNPLYIGRYIWNRSKWVKDPDTGKRKRRERPESEWIKQDAPQLRIISDQLWRQVQARLNTSRHESARQVKAGKNTGGRGPKYLFSGLLKCGVCGSNFVMSNSRSYGCASLKERGKDACSNTALVRRDITESRLLEGIKRDLLSPEAVDLFKREIIRLQKESRQASPASDIKKQITKLDREIDNIVDAIAQGFASETLKTKLVCAEQQRTSLTAELRVQTRPAPDISDILAAVSEYKQIIERMEAEVGNDVNQARESIKELLGDKITLQPHADGHLQAHLGIDLNEVIQLAAGDTGSASTTLVAGTCYGRFRPIDLK